jgi:hypothetical protein
MADATRTPTRSPNGHATLRRGRVAERVTRLREQAQGDPRGAREEAGGWTRELGRRVVGERAGALTDLQELFLCGQPSEGISGQTKGILVTWTTHPLVDKLIGSITNAWMPWLGKKFDPDAKRGEDTLSSSARWPAKLLWPLYSTGESPLGRNAFEFQTYVQAGRLDPAIDVLVIDYESVSANPLLLIRQIRDELVQIVPGAHLGKLLVNVPRRAEPFQALYFALKSEL